MDTEVDVPNPSLVWVPGMYAEVDLVVKEAKNAVVVPVTAGEASEEGAGAENTHWHVMVVKDRQIERREVTRICADLQADD